MASRRVTGFAMVCGVGFLGRLSYEMIRTPITPLYAAHLGAPVQLIGLIVAAVTITGIVVKLPAGGLSDQFGFRRLMLAGAWVKATGPFLYLIAFSWPLLLGVRFYHGLATALYAPPASALISSTYPRERGRRLGMYNAAESSGVVLGPVIGGIILSLTLSNFTAAFLVAGVIGILALVVMWRVPRQMFAPDPSTAPTPTLRATGGSVVREAVRGIRQVLSDPRMRLVSLVEAALWLGIGSLQAYLPLYALGLGLPLWQIGTLAGGQGIASVFSRPIMGRFSDRLHTRRPLIIAGTLICIATLAVIGSVEHFLPLLLLSVLFGLGTGIVTPSTMAMIGDLATVGHHGSAMGVFGSLWDAGHALGPILFGFLLIGFGYRESWLIMAGIMAVALVVFSVAGSGRRGSGLDEE